MDLLRIRHEKCLVIYLCFPRSISNIYVLALMCSHICAVFVYNYSSGPLETTQTGSDEKQDSLLLLSGSHRSLSLLKQMHISLNDRSN